MRKLLMFLLLLNCSKYTIGQGKFHMRYGSGYRDQGFKAIQTHDGNYVCVGYTYGFGSDANAFMMKVDTTGDIIWLKDYEGINRDIPWDVLVLPSGDLMICGSTGSYGEGSSDGFVTKTDSTGNIIWSKTYGTINYEEFYKITPDETNGFYLAGYSTQPGAAGTALVKLDVNGNILWSKWVHAWTAQGDYWPIDFARISSGGVILTGVGNQVSCWKFSPSGNLLWSNSYDCNNNFGTGIKIIENLAGDIFVHSIMIDSLTVAHSMDAGVIKLDSIGNIIWAKSYGGTYFDNDRYIAATRDTGIILCGNTNSVGTGTYDEYLIKINKDGVVNWAKAYGDVWAESYGSVVQTADDGYLLCAQSIINGTNADSIKVYLVKTDSVGNTTCNAVPWIPAVADHSVDTNTAVVPQDIIYNVHTDIPWPVVDRVFYQRNLCNLIRIDEFSKSELFIFPNPTQNTFIIKNISPKEEKLLQIINPIGEIIHSEKLSGKNEYVIDANLTPGIYFIRISAEENIFVQKLIVE